MGSLACCHELQDTSQGGAEQDGIDCYPMTKEIPALQEEKEHGAQEPQTEGRNGQRTNTKSHHSRYGIRGRKREKHRIPNNQQFGAPARNAPVFPGFKNLLPNTEAVGAGGV